MTKRYTLNDYLNIQMMEIEEHKYYLSEKVGHDVGVDYAVRDWIDSGHAERFNKDYVRNLPSIEDTVKEIGIGAMTIEDIHRILKD